MKKFCWISVCGAVLLTGCGNTAEQDALVKNGIRLMSETADTFEKMVADPSEANIKKCQKTLKKLVEQLEDNAQKLSKLPKNVQNRLDTKYKKELAEAKGRMEKVAAQFKGLIPPPKF